MGTRRQPHRPVETPPLVLFISIVFFGLSTLGALSTQAQSILIYSTNHSDTEPSLLSNATGVLNVEISTFSPILELKVNGVSRETSDTTRAHLSIPYQLKRGENRFEVFVKTEAITERREYVLTLIELDALKKTKKPYQVIAMAGVTTTDNAANASEDPQAGTKIGITVIPRLDYTLFNHHLQFQGILLRETYLESDLSSQEVVFTQAGVGWLNTTSFGDWRVDLGWTDIGMESAGVAAETAIETDLFIGGQCRLDALDHKNISLDFRYTLKNLAEGDGTDYDGDGVLIAVGAAWQRQLGELRGKIQGAFETHDAKGIYQDYSGQTLAARGDYPLDKRTLVGGAVSIKSLTYNTADPLKGDKEVSSLNSVALNGSYAFPQFDGILAMGSVSQKTKTSNISSLEYTTTSVSLSAVYVY